MAKLKKAVRHRKIERPYTRKSKFSGKSFIRANPALKVVRYDMGAMQKKFEYSLYLVAKDSLQIRDNAIESARQTSNRILEAALGKTGYMMKIRMYPHHILRENPLAAGAGADRMSTGMQLAFGKPIGAAAQVKCGKVMIELGVDKNGLELGKKALKRASYKVPCSCSIQVVENKKK